MLDSKYYRKVLEEAVTTKDFRVSSDIYNAVQAITKGYASKNIN